MKLMLLSFASQNFKITTVRRELKIHKYVTLYTNLRSCISNRAP